MELQGCADSRPWGSSEPGQGEDTGEKNAKPGSGHYENSLGVASPPPPNLQGEKSSLLRADPHQALEGKLSRRPEAASRLGKMAEGRGSVITVAFWPK